MFDRLSLLLTSGRQEFTFWLSRILMIMTMVTAFFTYKGAALGASTFNEHASATVFAIGSAVAIYAFWSLVFKSALDWETPETKRLGLIVVGVGVCFILPLSSVFNASGIDRGQVLDHHQTLYINDLSDTLEALLAENKSLTGIISGSRQREGRYDTLGKDEGQYGTTSGVAGNGGAVQTALIGAAKRFDGLAQELEDFQEEADKTLKAALVRLERIRAIAGSSKPIGERDRLIKNEVDILRADFAKLDGDAMKDAAERTIASIPREVRLAANYSKNDETKQAQADALDRLSDELETSTEELLAALNENDLEGEDEIPLYDPMSPTRAIIAYWPQVVPQLAGGAAIDLMPLALLFFCLVSLSARTAEETAVDALLNGTSGAELFRIIAIWDALKDDKQSDEVSQSIRDAALRNLKKG